MYHTLQFQRKHLKTTLGLARVLQVSICMRLSDSCLRGFNLASQDESCVVSSAICEAFNSHNELALLHCACLILNICWKLSKTPPRSRMCWLHSFAKHGFVPTDRGPPSCSPGPFDTHAARRCRLSRALGPVRARAQAPSRAAAWELDAVRSSVASIT